MNKHQPMKGLDCWDHKIMPLTIEQRLERIEHTVMGWDIYLRNIQSNQKFYLEKRLPNRQKRDLAYQASVRKFEELSKALEAMEVPFKKGYGKLSMFLCTRNQARKLRKLAEEDLREGHAWKGMKNNGEKK